MRGLIEGLFFGCSLSEPIRSEDLAGLKKYKYSAQDNSLLSKYVLSHYWNWLVTLFPLWMAPNMITLIGLQFIAKASLLTIIFAPTLSEKLPAWLYYFIGASVWIYASLDAIDGKHARRTGQCGPLGELFDHGCDALNMALMNLIFPMVFGYSMNWSYFIIASLFLMAFYVVTWDELHTHTLYLTVISGPVEGNVFFTFCSLLTGYLGVEFWSQPLTKLLPFLPNLNICNRDVVTLSLIIGGIGSIWNSLDRVKSFKASLDLLPFVLFLCSSAYCLLYERYLWKHMVKVILYIGFTFAHAIASLILAHLTLTKPKLYQPTYTPCFIAAVMVMAKQLGYTSFSQSSAIVYLNLSLIYSVVSYFIRAKSTVNQIARYLDIYCLSIKQKKA